MGYREDGHQGVQEGDPLLSCRGCEKQTPQQPQQQQADEAPRLDHARNCPHPPRRPLQGQACGVPQADGIGSSPRHRAVQGQRRAASVTDALFKKAKTAKKKDEELFFEKDKESVIDDSRKAIQKQVDDMLVAEISKTPLLKAYLSSKFSLKKGQKPHAMTF